MNPSARADAMKHGEKVAPVLAAVTSVVAIACCLPIGFAVAAVTASFSMSVAAYQPWFLGASSAERRARRLVFLTRGGCANTTVMRRNLDAALKSLGLAARDDVVDQDILLEPDVRRGCPTPTLLYHDRDVFRMSAPKPPLADPT